MTNLLPDAEVVAAYLEVRGRVVGILRDLDEADATVTVPSCPGWTVAELASHMMGVVDDILEGRMEGVTTDPWTQAQVERLRGLSLAQLADHYEASAGRFDAVLPHVPSPSNSQLVMDAVTHEHDLREAVGRAGAHDSLAVRVALGWLLNMAEGRQPGLAARLRDSGVSEFDLLRSLSGRRSAAQMTALGLPADEIVSMLAGSPLKPPASGAAAGR
ncbi:MAG: maleylpyruvate isomerase family mycothiol-dependent enzyme [Ilumatobacteraceae bacterium]